MGKICGDREHWVSKYGWVHHVWLALNVLNECAWGLVLNFSIQSREECTRNNRESHKRFYNQRPTTAQAERPSGENAEL